MGVDSVMQPFMGLILPLSLLGARVRGIRNTGGSE